ncbi:hypothetical protein diail_10791 [Diaporthe ilicicola]|nr:hypothetical protein diail_10791 [Diaporthe ilicicola]
MSVLQSAIIQSPSTEGAVLSLTVSDSVAIPEITTPYHVLVQVTAVALNATDFKMSTRFHMENNVVGCDFCGVVMRAGKMASDSAPEGTRVCGAIFPYRPDNGDNGAFAQWLVADSRHLLRVPENWTNTQAAALGAVGWSTVGLCMSDPEALALVGRPTCPVAKPIPILVYGGATATGLLAIQILKL